MMTGKERIMASLRGKQTDHLCWSPLVDQYFISSLPAQGYPELNVPDAVRLLKADIVERHCPVVKLQYDSNIIHSIEQKDDTILETFETPVGVLQVEKLARHSLYLGQVTRHMIETIDDIKILCYLAEHSHYVSNYHEYYVWASLVTDDGIVTAEAPPTPIQMFLQELCSVEQTFYFLVDHQDEIETCFDLLHQRNLQAYDLLAQGPAEVLIDYEDTSSTVISPDYYRKYCHDKIDQYADICHGAGKCFLTHMCGKLSVFNQQLQTGRQDGIDSVCPATTGDIWIDEARNAWGTEKIIVGGIEPPKLERMTVKQTRHYVTQLLDRMPSFTRFILSTGDATAHGTPVENLLAVSEVVQNYPWK